MKKNKATNSFRPFLESLEKREVMSVSMPSIGLAYVGLSHAPAAEVSYMANKFKAQTSEVEVSFLPFEFNPSNPFGNATKLVQETLPGAKGKLHMTVDLKWFVHNGSDRNYGPPAERAFEAAWAAKNPNAQQKQIQADFLVCVQKADLWVSQIRTWAANNGLQNKFGATFVPVLEDSFQSQTAYQTMVNAIKAQQNTDKVATTLRRSLVLGTNSPATSFRISGLSLELHGLWSEVKGKLRSGDTWSNDGYSYGIDDFVNDEKKAKQAGVSVLYWNLDMNGERGTRNTDTNWALRPIHVFSGSPAAPNKARLTLVLDVF